LLWQSIVAETLSFSTKADDWVENDESAPTDCLSAENGQITAAPASSSPIPDLGSVSIAVKKPESKRQPIRV
jgi:hypothetical protein